MTLMFDIATRQPHAQEHPAFGPAISASFLGGIPALTGDLVPGTAM
jgi:hypothetical protein